MHSKFWIHRHRYVKSQRKKLSALTRKSFIKDWHRNVKTVFPTAGFGPQPAFSSHKLNFRALSQYFNLFPRIFHGLSCICRVGTLIWKYKHCILTEFTVVFFMRYQDNSIFSSRTALLAQKQ